MWESGRRRYLSYALGTNTPLVTQTPSWDLFDCARDLFVEAFNLPWTIAPAILRMVAASLQAGVDLGPERERAQDEH